MDEQNESPTLPEIASAHSATVLRELQQRAQSALSASREQVSRLEADITRQLDQIAVTLNEQTASDAHGLAENDRLHAEIARLNDELGESRAAWLEERNDLVAQRDEFAATAARLETQHHASQDEWRNQLLDFEGRLRDQQESWNQQRSEWALARTALEADRDELQQKFALALQDVQRLRGRVAELEQELARRPEANQADSAELVALRAERDALSERVEQLEQRPAAPIDWNVEQQLSDLRRRFELAVEDVRELKTKNAKLESQLAEAGPRSHGQPDSGGMDWESQKRRLLATLEGGGDAHDNPVQQQQRATIEGTIEMTDAVVAKKDQQIAELQIQLEAAHANPARDDAARGRIISDLVDADEVVAEHRKRALQLERETEEKLRTAELELSVERAKIARQKVELEELRANLESQRQSHEANGGATAPGTPRRRWLSKLGIDGKE